MSSRVFIILLFLALGNLTPADAQDQQPPTPQAVQPTLSFGADAAVILNIIRESSAADFDFVIGKLKEALASSENPVRQQQAASWRVYRATAPSQTTCPDGTSCSAFVYIFVFDPVVKGAEYDPVKILAEAYPTEVGALYEKLKLAYVRFDSVSLASLGMMGSQR